MVHLCFLLTISTCRVNNQLSCHVVKWKYNAVENGNAQVEYKYLTMQMYISFS